MIAAHALARDLRRYVDLATFDIVVSLEGEKPSHAARIRVPDGRRDEILRFCRLFGVTGVDFEHHQPVRGWVEITFPVALESGR